jgi:serine/threonine-protein kinase
MEYIEGQSCAEILRDDGWVDLEEAVSIIEQACEGLHYAHRHGVVHRDVKPGNLLRSRDGEVKLADFGIAKATEQSSITQVGSVLGTAAYLAPEQARGEEAGPRADLYALGVVAYQLIAGRLPYEATSLTELALKQQQEEPPTLDTIVADVSPELADAVAIALALDPRERYATARDMGDAIADAMRGIPPTEPATGTRGAPATAATSLLSANPRGTNPRGTVTPRQPRPGPPRQQPPVAAPAPRASGAGRVWATLFAVLLLAVVVVAVIFVTSPASTTIKLHNVIYKDVNQSATALKELVAENTK